MGINVSTSMGFENREFLQNSAKNILQKSGADENTSKEVLKQVEYTKPDIGSDSLFVLKSSTQITMSNSLKETLKYLQAHANDKRKKKYILGELWETISDSETPYSGDFEDFVVDLNEPNIFAA